MSNIYKAQQKANIDVDSVVGKLVKEGGDIDLEYFLLQLTARHPVSEGSIRKRIDRWVTVYKDVLVVEEGQLRSGKSEAKK